MRIFLPLTPADRVALETSSTVIELEAGRDGEDRDQAVCWSW